MILGGVDFPQLSHELVQPRLQDVVAGLGECEEEEAEAVVVRDGGEGEGDVAVIGGDGRGVELEEDAEGDLVGRHCERTWLFEHHRHIVRESGAWD